MATTTTTTINLSPGLVELIEQRVASGEYESAEAVLGEALALLDERDRVERLRAAIAVGDAQIARGEGIEWTAERWAELDREVDERLRRGERPNPDVCP